MIIIGIGHRARSGKDTIAEHMVKNYGFTRYALADKLKESVNLVTGWNQDHAFGHLKEVVDPYFGISPRAAYQGIGTSGYRSVFGASVWAKALRLQIEADAAKSASPDQYRVVIADLRFREGEVEMVKAMGGLLWKVNRPGLPALTAPPKSQFMRQIHKLTGKDKSYSHQSEWDLQDFEGWDAVFNNNGTIDELYAKVDQVLTKDVLRL
jgi:hypothetical protein